MATRRKTKTDDNTVKVKVREGWAVHDGTTQHHGGAVVTVDRATADTWTSAGWVEPTSG